MSPEDMTNPQSCPLCDRAAEEVGWARNHSRTLEVSCRRCGRFRISGEALESLPRDKKHLLAAVCRLWPAEECPTILTTNIEALIDQAPKLSITAQMDSLLDRLAQNTTVLGSWSTFQLDNDYPLLALRGPDEATFLARALEERGLVSRKATAVSLTIKGWERFEEIRRSGRESNLAFVAMWFNDATAELFEKGIKPAIRDAGYEPLRIDQHEHNNRIDDEIIGQIRRSRFMVADFTGQRPGVYFESGLMMGLGRNVIWLCDKAALSQVHFDVRQYNFIAWETFGDARTRLVKRILALEGEGPIPVPCLL